MQTVDELNDIQG